MINRAKEVLKFGAVIFALTGLFVFVPIKVILIGIGVYLIGALGSVVLLVVWIYYVVINDKPSSD